MINIFLHISIFWKS